MSSSIYALVLVIAMPALVLGTADDTLCVTSEANSASILSLGHEGGILDALSEVAMCAALFVGVWFLGSRLGFRNRRKKSASRKTSGTTSAQKAYAPARPSVAELRLPSEQGKSERRPSRVSCTVDGYHVEKGATQMPRPSLEATRSNKSYGSYNRREGVESSARGARASDSLLRGATDCIAAAVRMGNGAQLPQLIDATCAQLVKERASTSSSGELSAQLLLVALRACAAKRAFKEGLAAYDHVASRIGCACGSTWSLLLWCAVETGQWHRCDMLFKNIRAHGKPVGSDFVNLVRYSLQSKQRDPEIFANLIVELRALGCQVDLYARNRAVALCASVGALEFAEVVVASFPDVPKDVIVLNTLMKGYAEKQDLVKCFELHRELREAGLESSHMTFGILLDACIDAKQLDHAKLVFQELKRCGVPMNAVLYTTFIKGLVSSGELASAMELLDEMDASVHAQPDLVTYSTLLRAHSECGNVMESVRLVERMTKRGINPDAVVFNTVLSGCCSKSMDAKQIQHVFQWLLARGLQPSTCTLSILVKAFARSHAWEDALRVLHEAPTALGVWPDARIFAQVGTAAAKLGQGPIVFKALVSMIKSAGSQGVSVNKTTCNRLSYLCNSCGQDAAASKVLQLLKDADWRLLPQQLEELSKIRCDVACASTAAD